MDIVQPEGVANIPDSRGLNLFLQDPAFAPLLKAHMGEVDGAAMVPRLTDLGARAAQLDDWAFAADHNPPVLRPRTRRGEPLQSIQKHPDYVALEKVAFEELGLAALSHQKPSSRPLVKYALTFLFVQSEFGLCCPVSMTDSLTRTLRRYGNPALVARFLPNLIAQDLDTLYQGAMFMTEQAAGSDVARTATQARLVDGTWRLYGDKWFCSNPDAGLAMVLARPEGAKDGIDGLALFLLPRTLPDGSRNHYQIMRLKDKLGTRSMASGEIVLDGAEAYLVGELGRGFHQMADMINMSRLSNGVRAAGLMRRATTEALYVARNRHAFGRALIDMPLMQRQLLKIMLPAEQARSMFMHTATCLERADAGDAQAAKLVRILTPLIKFRACRDARRVTGDAMEVRGGVGYIEEWVEPRLVRDSHLGSIWEGTSNIVALDVLRAVKREGVLLPYQQHLHDLLLENSMPTICRTQLGAVLDRTCDLVNQVAMAGPTELTRRAASALYHISSAIIMAWEAARMQPDYRRLALAQLVLRYRLLPSDPLAGPERESGASALRAILDECPISLDDALSLAETD